MQTALDFYAAHGFWVWATVAAALLTVELITGSGWLLWPSVVAAVVAFGAQLFGLTAPLDVLVFAILTIVATFLSRKLVPRMDGDGPDINDNHSRLVGHHGHTVAAFQQGEGRVFIDGKEWAALTHEGDIALGAKVLVTGVEGAKLRVKVSEA